MDTNVGIWNTEYRQIPKSWFSSVFYIFIFISPIGSMNLRKKRTTANRRNKI